MEGGSLGPPRTSHTDALPRNRGRCVVDGVHFVKEEENSFFKADHTIDLIFYNVVAIRENKTRRAESSIHSSPVAL